MTLQGCHRRGGYQPPAQYKPTIMNPLRRMRTMFRYARRGGAASRAVQTYNHESAWANSYYVGRGTLQPNTFDPEQKREAESLPYNGYELHAIQSSAVPLRCGRLVAAPTNGVYNNLQFLFEIHPPEEKACLFLANVLD